MFWTTSLDGPAASDGLLVTLTPAGDLAMPFVEGGLSRGGAEDWKGGEVHLWTGMGRS